MTEVMRVREYWKQQRNFKGNGYENNREKIKAFHR